MQDECYVFLKEVFKHFVFLTSVSAAFDKIYL